LEPLAQTKRLGHVVGAWSVSCNAQNAFEGILVPIFGDMITALNSRHMVLEIIPGGELVTYWRDDAPVFQIEMIHAGEKYSIRLLAVAEGCPAVSHLVTKCLEHFARWFQDRSHLAGPP